MKVNKRILQAYFMNHGLPPFLPEYRFHPDRKWRFDYAWPEAKVALEVDGGIFIKGGHCRGAQMKKTWEKENTAQAMGWHIFKCEPKSAMSQMMVDFLKVVL